MSKYTPLTQRLRNLDQSHVPMTFSQIEDLLGFDLPPSARRHRAWWSNNPSNSVMTKAWLAAGYQSEQVDLEQQKLVFSKRNETPSSGPGATGTDPLFGCMRGTVTLAADTDLTEPLEPEWPDSTLEKFDRILGRK